MTKDIKILDGDVVFFGGDFRVSESTNQEVDYILQSVKGVWRQNPLVGVDLIAELNGEATSEQLKKKIQVQIEYDNKRVIDLNVNNNIIDINAEPKQ